MAGSFRESGLTLGDAGTAIDLARSIRKLAATAPPTVKRDATQFAASIGAAQ